MADAKTTTLQEARRQVGNPLRALLTAQGEANPRRKRRAARKQWAGGSKKASSRMQKLRPSKATKKRIRKQSRVRHGR
jgi:hypothetical protein